MDNSFQLREYAPENLGDVLAAISEDPDWAFLTGSEQVRQNYAERLQSSITYVCYSGELFCGYIRAIVDAGMALYISELFVTPEYRNQKIGQHLIEKIKASDPSSTVYALSDEDLYYEKKGYRKIGSVFEI